MKKAYILLFDEVEEVEFITPLDYLRRAGIEVVVAGASALEARGRSGVALKADKLIAELKVPADCLIVPGGPGTGKIAANKHLLDSVRAHFQAGKLVAAICAAPALVLGASGILKGKRFTCFPGMEGEVGEGHFLPERVVTDGKIITSRAAGTAGEFARAIIAELLGKAAADKIAEDVLL